MSDIIVDNLSKSFGEKVVLSGFSALFEKGKVTAIMGDSGCGKTTLLRIIAGLEVADSGTANTNDSKISFVFQENRLCEDFTAISNIKMLTGKTVADVKIINDLTSLGLGDSLTSPVKELSGGMKRRVAILRALSVDFDLLIMDEPFKGLDKELKTTVIDFVKSKTNGKTVIFVTHDLSETENFADKIISMT